MKKIILDTNIFVSAILGPSGASRIVLLDCLKEKFLPLMGEALFREYEDLLQREHIFAGCVLGKDDRNLLLDAFLSTCEWVTVYSRWRPNLRDEADNHLVELAVAGGADYLVTHNIKDFINPELHFPAVKIIDPITFLKEI